MDNEYLIFHIKRFIGFEEETDDPYLNYLRCEVFTFFSDPPPFSLNLIPSDGESVFA